MNTVNQSQEKNKTTDWSVNSWQNKTVRQQATYPDKVALANAVDTLSSLPPLVTSWEVKKLKSHLAEVQHGKRFLIQGGDCAETFSDCTSPIISNRLKVLIQMSLVLIHGCRTPIVRVGRFAGQYAKPRSADTETRDGVTLPSFRGDIVNENEFTEQARHPEPKRMLEAYHHSAMTMNFVRALVDGGFADIRHPEYWDLAWVKHSPNANKFHELVEKISDSINFAEILAGREVNNLSNVEFFSSHEALHLHYEQALTRQVPRQDGHFNLSTHLPWIGLRTNQMDSAHVELLRGIENPVGVKIGKETESDHLVDLVRTLNPNDEDGKIILIHRFGAENIETHLPRLIDVAQKAKLKVVWVSDPMHGNTESTSNGYKTRRYENIRKEVEMSFKTHKANGSHLGGVHLELTGENVTECLGGARALQEADLSKAYTTQVDPRLNYEQALELAFAIKDFHRA
ncbi:class II 3-deoxy-7-phosphoheptulonate synthase [Marinicella rhabdoformis]|uniref:class II 3-deoxy-7-phosphoheptulonate synthase n=1 Tax=Marinicella rhabdoformis TaxID=2580566 RepID=UPI0012AED9FD|nr:3-deoxy-7-phosphoheptulonate synthase class II [Marinicella rhabdoformis]